MNATTKVKLREIIPNLTCPICKGYFVDATTIIECLHSFCKSCIVTHLEASEYCPVCDVQLHSSKPLSSIRSDQMLQEVVYKLVPGLFQNEMERRRKFYKEHPESTPTTQLDSGQMFNESYISSDDIIYLSLECQSNDAVVMESTKRYIKCPAAVSIGILKSLLQNKYDLSREATIDMMYGDRVLPDDFLLMDIAYKYSWTPNGKHLPIRFRVRGNTALFKPVEPSSKNDAEVENKPVAGKKKYNLSRRKSLADAKQLSQLNDGANNFEKVTNGKQNSSGVNTQIPVRGRRKKKSLDTEKELTKIRAAAAATTESKEVQLRISENGVMRAWNVTSGEEKIIGAKHSVKGLPTSPNGAKTSNHLMIPQVVPASAKALKSSLIPKFNQSPKTPVTPAGLSSNKPINLTTKTRSPKTPRKTTKPKVVDKPRTQASAKLNRINKNMNLKAMSLKIQEELEATLNYFAAEITPINGTPPPKSPQPKEALNYPAATLQPTDLLASKQSSQTATPAFNKRLNQTTAINGDANFTKSFPTSPVQTVPSKAKDLKPSLSTPTGSPNKTPKFFKSRQAPDGVGPLVSTSANIVTSNIQTNSHASSVGGKSFSTAATRNRLAGKESFQKLENDSSFTKIPDISKMSEPNTPKYFVANPPKLDEINPPKKVKLDQQVPFNQGPTLSLVTGTVTVPSSGSSTVTSTGQQPSTFRYPANFSNGVPMSLVPFITNSFSSPFLSNPNFKNMPIFTNPYLGFTTASQFQTFPSNLTSNAIFTQGFNNVIIPASNSGITHNTTLNRPELLNEAPTKNSDTYTSHESPLKNGNSKAKGSSPSNKTKGAKIIAEKVPNQEEALAKTQTLLSKIHNLGASLNGNGKTPRKSMSPAKFTRISIPDSSTSTTINKSSNECSNNVASLSNTNNSDIINGNNDAPDSSSTTHVSNNNNCENVNTGNDTDNSSSHSHENVSTTTSPCKTDSSPPEDTSTNSNPSPSTGPVSSNDSSVSGENTDGVNTSNVEPNTKLESEPPEPPKPTEGESLETGSVINNNDEHMNNNEETGKKELSVAAVEEVVSNSVNENSSSSA